MKLDKCNIGYIILVSLILSSYLIMSISIEMAGIAAFIAFVSIIVLVLHMVACEREESCLKDTT